MIFRDSKKRWWFRTVCLTCLGAAILAGWIWGGWRQPTTEEMNRLCLEAARKQQWTTLQEQGERWAASEPENGKAWMYVAQAMEQQQKFDEAAKCLTRIPASAPEADSAQIARMELAFGPRNRAEDGAIICETILKQNPQSKVAQQRLIFFLAMSLQRHHLQKQIRAAIQSGSEPREAYVYLFFADSLHFSNGASWNGQWLQGDPQSELFEVAQAIFIAQTLDTSISMDDREAAQSARNALARKGPVLDRLLKRYPHNIELLAYQLRESVKSGTVGRALKLLSQAPVESESDGRFWRYKGWIHAQRGEEIAAEDAYHRALELNPLDWGTRHFLAELRQRQQRFDDAERLRELVSRANELRRVLHSAPSASEVPPAILGKLARYALDCGDKQMADALQRRLQQFSPLNRNALRTN
jgi:tetratricopeptide (TPR) repeat protein